MAVMRPAFAFVAAAMLAAPAAAGSDWTPPPAKDGYAYPACYCTNRGENVPIGGYACLKIGSREVLARCGMSLNNPAWRTVQEGCPPDPRPGASLLLEFLQRPQPG
jgi:hypothetical protein